ncbi:MAG: glycosyltransferase family 2 protein [Bacteroidales bacterium]|nr:glycosyltransferase family 2 protein [Bacteroidales bacterium]
MPLTALNTLILIPTYNNAGTLEDVVRRALRQGYPVLVVDDGSTDRTPELLQALQKAPQHQEWHFSRQGDRTPVKAGMLSRLSVITHRVNLGKGSALKTGFEEARRRGYRYVVSLDADGQHFPEDIPALLEAGGENTLVVGSRSIRGNSGGSSFANRFSNFWFKVFTWKNLPDTQTGFRLYPLEQLPSLSILSARYEAEFALLVFSAWKGVKLLPVPVNVAYPNDRVSHFRPVADFLRITLLNIGLLVLSILYGWPRMLLF